MVWLWQRQSATLIPQSPIIFLTAKNQEENIIEGFKTGADDYITKPFSMEELLYRIEAIFQENYRYRQREKMTGYIILVNTCLTVKDNCSPSGISKIKPTTKESKLLELPESS